MALCGNIEHLSTSSCPDSEPVDVKNLPDAGPSGSKFSRLTRTAVSSQSTESGTSLCFLWAPRDRLKAGDDYIAVQAISLRHRSQIGCRLSQEHIQSDCQECPKLPFPTHHCQALIALCQDCGQQQPVIVDACQVQGKHRKMPVRVGTVEGKSVKSFETLAARPLWYVDRLCQTRS